ncbi:MAG: Asp-tRNA(Asn)/Glu-tRNA(Gln) amidotransferase subunit GatC [Candidatus Omnitrophota bacterium]
MSIDKKTLDYVAHLARIELTGAELEKLSFQLQGILDFIEKLNSLNTENVACTSHILPLANISREDLGKDSLSSEKVLENAPQKQGVFFAVPQVIE